MKKLLIASITFLFVAGFVSMAWAHGPNGRSSGIRSQWYWKPHHSRSPHSHIGGGLRQHHRKFARRPISRSMRRSLPPRGVISGSRRQPLAVNGFTLGKPRSLRNKRFFSPFTRRFNRNFGVRIQSKAPVREELQQEPLPSFSHNDYYYSNNPDPWFLYGKGDAFRQLGLIPPSQ